jgi:hypothetical protein
VGDAGDVQESARGAALHEYPSPTFCICACGGHERLGPRRPSGRCRWTS